MSKAKTASMFQRKSLDKITEIPNDLISVYVVEDHIWADKGSDSARQTRQAETRTINEFLINPVRPFLNDIFRQISAPYDPERKDNPIGQGYWIQAEFGSGKSHLVSFVGALALGDKTAWEIIRDKEKDANLGRRESLYNFYENGLAKKSADSKGVFVAVKTLVGQGGNSIGIEDKSLIDYTLDAVADQFYRETGQSLPLYPTEILAKRFLETDDFARYQSDLAKFLRDPQFFDDEEQEELNDFLDDLRNNQDPGVQRDCGQKLWDFYDRHLKTRPHIPLEPEELLKHMVQQLLDFGYAGLLLILDEVSLYMSGREQKQRGKDEQAMVILSNRLAKVENLPVWTICTAQQAIESRTAGTKNIIARERLDLVPLLSDPDAYYDIALPRVRKVLDEVAIDSYYADYQRSFSWPTSIGKNEFARFFPFYPPSIQVVKSITAKLTTLRSALYFLLEALKHQRKLKSQELITLWGLFEEVVNYEEDPSGTTRSVAAIKTAHGDAWKAYESAIQQLDTITKGPLKVYRERCEKIIKTLFLYHVADAAPNGLSHEELMNSVMEWRDHAKGQTTDLQDNLDHYETLIAKISSELAQVVTVDNKYQFNPTGGGIDPRVHFETARAAAADSEIEQQQAWEALLAFQEWGVATALMTMDLTFGIRSVFREIAPASHKDLTLTWHGRETSGRLYMRDLLQESRREIPLPTINSEQTDLDFAVFISSSPTGKHVDELMKSKKDPRILFWTPDELTAAERTLLTDFAAYRSLIGEFRSRDDQQGKDVLNWVQNRLRDNMGSIYKIVPDAYGRGQIKALDHAQMSFNVSGELPAILMPLVSQALDAAYECRDLNFDAPTPFSDINAVHVINGIVKVSEIERGARPNRETSAAQNFGFALQIMRRPNNHKLDLNECRYAKDILDWINEKLSDSTSTMPVESIYKNFMGLAGPNGLHYGLSRRLIQLYLLCLVRDAKIRITLSGRNQPVEFIDYTNIADIDFRAATLQGFELIQKLQPPEGWDTLAPFAAILLGDESIRTVQQDADIQKHVQQLLQEKEEEQIRVENLATKLDNLFTDMGQENPAAEPLAAWRSFWSTDVEPDNAINYLRHALDQSFGYKVFAEERWTPDEVDDLKSRQNELNQIEQFAGYADRLRVIARYAKLKMPDDQALSDLITELSQVTDQLSNLNDMFQNETQLHSQLIEPAETAIEKYRTRYIQVFETVTSHAENVRQQISDLRTSPEAKTLQALDEVTSLGDAVWPTTEAAIDEILAAAAFMPTTLSRVEVERELRQFPLPTNSQLTLGNGSEWRDRSDAALAQAHTDLQTTLITKVGPLQSSALRQRLEQGKKEPLIAQLLATQSNDELCTLLVELLGQDESSKLLKLLNRYLRAVRIQEVRLADFAPSQATIEPNQVEQVVDEFRIFLQEQVSNSSSKRQKDESVIIELK